MTLWVEEHLDVPHIVGARALQIGESQIVEILLRDQHGHALIIDVEKILQVAKPVGLAQRFNRGVGQADAVAAGEREHQLGFQAAFDVDMQFTFWQSWIKSWVSCIVCSFAVVATIAEFPTSDLSRRISCRWRPTFIAPEQKLFSAGPDRPARRGRHETLPLAIC